jgi:hypothetical protein
MSKNAICCTVIVICLFTTACFAKYSGGTGDSNAPYLIATPNDLNTIGLDSNDWDKHFKMVADINLSEFNGTQFNIIGDYPSNPFSGIFDGNGHTIYNFKHTSMEIICVGLFRHVSDSNALITNLRLVDPNVDAGWGSVAGYLVGSLVGYLQEGTINKCSVEGCRVRGAEPLGGMVGQSGGLITDCYAEGTVIGTYFSDDVGVLLGLNQYGDVANCYSAGFAQGDWDIGGLVGNLSNGTMIDCFSTADVNGIGAVGGLIGHHYRSTTRNCWSTGRVSGNFGLGGFVGENPYGTIEECFSGGAVSATDYAGGFIGKSTNGHLVNCYSKGSSCATNDYVGGFVGYCYDTQITHCYSTGQVSGSQNYIGGFAGYSHTSSYRTPFWNCDINSDVNSIGNGSDPNVIGLPTAEMQRRSTFADAGWDMVNVWDIGENQTYPFLRTHLPSDINKDDETNFFDLAILTENWLGEK